MKWVKRILLVLVVLLVGAVLTADLYLGKVIKSVTEGTGPSLVGVPLKLESAQFRLLQGVIRLNGFVLGNPEGFKTDKAIGVGQVAVDIDVRSLFTDTIVIKRILIDQPEIVYELGLGKSNIGRILEGLGGEEEEAKPEDEQQVEDEGGKKVIIEDLLVKDAKVRVSMTVAQGVAAPIPLPDIHLTDIGKEEGKKGASPVEVIRRVLGAIFGAVGKVVTGTVDLVGDGAKAVGGAAVDAGKAVGDGAKVVGGAALDAGKAVGGAVGDGAKAVGGAVGDGAKAVGGAVGAGASKVVGGVKGLFGADEEQKAPDAASEGAEEPASGP